MLFYVGSLADVLSIYRKGDTQCNYDCNVFLPAMYKDDHFPCKTKCLA